LIGMRLGGGQITRLERASARLEDETARATSPSRSQSQALRRCAVAASYGSCRFQRPEIAQTQRLPALSRVAGAGPAVHPEPRRSAQTAFRSMRMIERHARLCAVPR
jgi:hypothetical protein